MYDAQQGATSGAHIDMSTTSGTNLIHGQLYLHRGTNALNAAPFFRQRRSEYSGQRQESANASLHRRWHHRRPHHQGQALRIYQLPAHPRFRSGYRSLALDCSAGPHRFEPHASGPGSACKHLLGYKPNWERRCQPHSGRAVPVQVAQRTVPDPLVGWPDGRRNISRKRHQPRHRLFHIRSSRRQSRLEQESEGHSVRKILLPARPERCSLRLLGRPRIPAASRCRQPGRIAHQYPDASPEPEPDRGSRHSAREGLQHHRTAFHTAVLRRPNRDNRDQHLRLSVLPRHQHRRPVWREQFSQHRRRRHL